MEPLESSTTDIAINVARTRINILVFNLAIISLMLKMSAGDSLVSNSMNLTNLTSSLAAFNGFCLTLLGLMIFLGSQRMDTTGNSKLVPFMFGNLTTYLALSQTITAFMHEYLIRFSNGLNGSSPEDHYTINPISQLNQSSLIILFIMGGILWVLITYVGPLSSLKKSSITVGKKKLLLFYYVALQVPIYFVYAEAWQFEYISAGQTSNLFYLFLLQFVQPLLWVIP